MTIRRITISEAEFIAHAMVQELMNIDDEPIPPFHTRSEGKLESCLAEPFQTFDGKLLHRNFTKRAAVLFYLVTKNHAFENGNKRMAVALTFVFFYINKKWVNVKQEELYKLACIVAESDPKDRDRVQVIVEKFFKNNMVKLPLN